MRRTARMETVSSSECVVAWRAERLYRNIWFYIRVDGDRRWVGSGRCEVKWRVAVRRSAAPLLEWVVGVGDGHLIKEYQSIYY